MVRSTARRHEVSTDRQATGQLATARLATSLRRLARVTGLRAVSFAAVGLVLLAAVPGARAAATPTVSVSQTTDLDPAGQQLTVRGTGFDESIGIYVAVCVDNGPGELPTPCIGGVDTTGAASSSAWISSNPPTYADGLTVPYGPGGSFEVALQVVAADPKVSVDCREAGCAVVTRADHTRTGDRSQDTRTPLSFAAGPPGTDAAPTSAPAPTQSVTAATAPVTAGAPARTADSEATTVTPAVDATSGPAASVWLWPVGALVLVSAVGVALRRIRGRPTTTTPSASATPRGPTS